MTGRCVIAGVITAVIIAWFMPTLRGLPAQTSLELREGRWEIWWSYNEGWPMACLTGEVGFRSLSNSVTDGTFVEPHGRLVAMIDTHLPLGASRYMPCRPAITGLVINTIFYAALWGLVTVAPRAWVRRRRAARGRCPTCGYDLRAIDARRCPECGAATTKPTACFAQP